VTKGQAASIGLELAHVGEERLDDALAVSGRVAFDDMRVTHVFSPLTGRVSKVFAELGARVKRDAPLVAIVSPDLGVASAEARRAAADLRAARHDFERKTELWRFHACSQAELEAAEDAFRRAQAEADRADQKLALLGIATRDVTQSFTLRAPMDGEILARTVSPGLEVAGLYGQATAAELFTVGEIDRVWVWADVHELDLARVRAGARAIVDVVAYPNERFEGTVDLVSRSLDPATRTAKVRISLANPGGLLKPEMYTRVNVAAPERRALAVRRDALVRLGDQSFVFAALGVAADGRLRFERRHVAVDDGAPGDWVAVEHGLEPGLEIVSHGALLLSAVQ
jgi:membrane fusion protein, heavy metal efflux system